MDGKHVVDSRDVVNKLKATQAAGLVAGVKLTAPYNHPDCTFKFLRVGTIRISLAQLRLLAQLLTGGRTQKSSPGTTRTRGKLSAEAKESSGLQFGAYEHMRARSE